METETLLLEMLSLDVRRKNPCTHTLLVPGNFIGGGREL